MHDNADGKEGAFSIQNIARMGLIYNKYPGEWHGPGSISGVMKDLNKMYLPIEDFQIVHFSDGMIYYDKVMRAAECPPRKYLIDLMNKNDISEEKLTRVQQLHTLFKKYAMGDQTQTVSNDNSQPSLMREVEQEESKEQE